MECKMSVKWNPGVKKELITTRPDKINYTAGRMLLDESYITIPKNTGMMRLSSTSMGVFKQNGKWSVGSFTDYAKEVYNYDNSKVNWTTPGTNSRWFHTYWKKHGQAIFANAVERNKLK